MQGIFLEKILNMSLIGCYSIIVVCLVRLLLLKCGRKYAYYLWLIAFFNLCVPLSINSIFSLIPNSVAEFSVTDRMADSIEQRTFISLQPEAGLTEGPAAGLPVSVNMADREVPEMLNVLSQTGQLVRQGNTAEEEAQGTNSKEPDRGRNHLQAARQMRTVMVAAEILWLGGIAGITLFNLFNILRLQRRIHAGTLVRWDARRRIAEMEGVDTPFLWGLFHPVIYLPAGMEREERRYIIAHESCHKKRKDHLVKIIVFAVTVIHWFNPLVWLAYALFCRDMEISCDEAVLAENGQNLKKQYAESLLKYAAGQNGYAMMPITFGEPSVKARIKNVLRFQKKSVAVSVFALICVLGVVLGLACRPSGNDDRADVPQGTDVGTGQEQETENNESNAGNGKAGSSSILNNGGNIIKVDGRLYYMEGCDLYSDGSYLYSTNEMTSPHEIYRYNMDGSGYLKLFEGTIVDCDDTGHTLYYIKDGDGQEEQGSIYAYDTQTGGSVALFPGTQSDPLTYLGRYGGFLYVARQDKEQLYIDCVKEDDGSVESNLLRQPLDAGTIVSFYADENYILFSAGSYEGSMGVFHGAFYTYNRSIGSLKKVCLTEAAEFHVVDEYVYYQKTSMKEETSELYRADFAFETETQIGENWTFLAYEEQKGTLLAEKQKPTGQFPYVRDLFRISLEGEELEKLFSAEEVASDFAIESELDKLYYTDFNLLEDSFYVKVSHWGYRDGISIGWRDALLQEEAFWVAADGSRVLKWDAEELVKNGEESWEDLHVSYIPVSTVYDTSEGSWDLNTVTDVRDSFSRMSPDFEPGTEGVSYLLDKTENYTLYGKGDYESMLLSCNGHYAEIPYLYASNYMIPVTVREADYDGDGVTELSMDLALQCGTGVFVEILLMADFQKEGELAVYRFWQEDYLPQLNAHLTFENTDEGTQAFVDGNKAGKALLCEYEDAETGSIQTELFASVDIGDQIRFDLDGDRIRIDADLAFWSSDFSGIAWYNENTISAYLDYQDGGIFTLTDFHSRNREAGE